jgi:hypothetical protein
LSVWVAIEGLYRKFTLEALSVSSDPTGAAVNCRFQAKALVEPD